MRRTGKPKCIRKIIEEESMKLTPENTLTEFFEYFDRGENAVQVVPITIKQQDDDSRMVILVRGKHDMASVIFAELMTRVDELFDMQAQMEAQQRESEPSIILT